MKTAKWSGADLKNWRVKRGLSQSAAAEMLGYTHRSAICKYESGANPVPMRLQMLCDTLDQLNNQ